MGLDEVEKTWPKTLTAMIVMPFYHVHGRLQELFSETCARSGTLNHALGYFPRPSHPFLRLEAFLGHVGWILIRTCSG
ncbi:hypothetical protein [Desulfonatronum sp. SC1]|uniref:hypothetical protein n=1 Tax=Desulfonatronum sp. SC1 TaxID=2109626 RepID=UPI000D31EB94|nr:hypothetical protein [Desulfonatronum sp. SC1]PTN38029.1 hypothetical protein C6366_03975 [Desulfonatronum sp. SC1]